jgi:hypothetical protein
MSQSYHSQTKHDSESDLEVNVRSRLLSLSNRLDYIAHSKIDKIYTASVLVEFRGVIESILVLLNYKHD